MILTRLEGHFTVELRPKSIPDTHIVAVTVRVVFVAIIIIGQLVALDANDTDTKYDW